MKKYLIQFCEELEASTGALDDFTPQYIPTKGVIAEISHENISEMMESVFAKYPKSHFAIVSEVKSGENDVLEYSEFKFIAVNLEWNGEKAKGNTAAIPIDIFNMMG